MIKKIISIIILLLIILAYIEYKNNSPEKFMVPFSENTEELEKIITNNSLTQAEMDSQFINLEKNKDDSNSLLRPSEIKLSGKLNRNSINLYWLPPETGSDTLKSYIIVMMKDSLGPKLYFPPDKNCKLCSYEINNLKYDSDYKFGIIALNEYGASDLSNMIIIKPFIPKKYKEKIPQKEIYSVSCLDNSTYITDKFCHKNTNIEPNLVEEDFKKLKQILDNQTKKLNFDFKIV